MGMKQLKMRPRIYILSIGELAEPQYFQDFKDYLRAHNIIIRYRKEFLKKHHGISLKLLLSSKKRKNQKVGLFRKMVIKYGVSST